MTARLPRHVAPLAVGEPTSLGPYQLLGRLDAGITGIVYLSRAVGGAQVAVRALHPGDALRADMRARFAAAIDRARVLAGAHTCGVLDAAPAAERPYMVTEFVGGPTLARELTERGPLSSDEIDRLARTLLETIDAAHRTVGALGDLTATDVVLSVTGPRLVDLGVAAALRPLLLSPAAGSAGGTAPGTPHIVAGRSGHLWPPPSSPGYVPGYGYGPAAGGWEGPAADIVAWAGIVDLAATGKPSGSVEPAARAGRRRADRSEHTAPIGEGVRRALARVRQADGASLPDTTELLALLAGSKPRSTRAAWGRGRQAATAHGGRAGAATTGADPRPEPTDPRPPTRTAPPGKAPLRTATGGRHSTGRRAPSPTGSVPDPMAARALPPLPTLPPPPTLPPTPTPTLPPPPTLPPTPTLPPPERREASPRPDSGRADSGRAASVRSTSARRAAEPRVERLPADPLVRARRSRMRPVAAFAVAAVAAVAAAATAAGLNSSPDDVTTGARAPLHESQPDDGGTVDTPSSGRSGSREGRPPVRTPAAPRPAASGSPATEELAVDEPGSGGPSAPGGGSVLGPTEEEQQNDLAAEDFALNTLRLAAGGRSAPPGRSSGGPASAASPPAHQAPPVLAAAPPVPTRPSAAAAGVAAGPIEARTPTTRTPTTGTPATGGRTTRAATTASAASVTSTATKPPTRPATTRPATTRPPATTAPARRSLAPVQVDVVTLAPR